MSRIGRKPIAIPSGVKIDNKDNFVTVVGPLGTLSAQFRPEISIAIEGEVVNVTRPNDEKLNRSLHGLTRSLLANMVEGVSKGFEKNLEIQGVGYRAEKTGDTLTLKLGYSHDVVIKDTDTVKTEMPKGSNTKIIVKGIDKQEVGQFAAEVRGWRPPEPYKGKGIRYEGEKVIRKEGKAGKGKK
ncbi:MAG: 50S ribosomal protein L6 [Ruminococcus sp.]|jgi:large subunit ribosomal protein L6|nr:50S ribosomal protein L6 [Ruminococcus sp.]